MESLDGACAICQDLLEGASGGTHVLHCGHVFHTACIVPWFRRESPGCPLCRDTGDTEATEEDVETASTTASSTATTATMRRMMLTHLRSLTRSSGASHELRRLLEKLACCLDALKGAKQLLRLHATHGRGQFKLLTRTQRHLQQRTDKAAIAVREAEDAALSTMDAMGV
jgi:hypothetical protein